VRIIGLDPGTKTIGVAMSDEFLWTAQPLLVIRRGSKELQELEALIKDYGVTEIVLGYPLNMNGTSGPRAEATEQLAEQLTKHFNLPVHLQDERLSTVAAEKMLISADVSRKKRKKVIDKSAAAIILQTYLDRRATTKSENLD
jgi:putative Holliday junction resolvase